MGEKERVVPAQSIDSILECDYDIYSFERQPYVSFTWRFIHSDGHCCMCVVHPYVKALAIRYAMCSVERR